MKKIFWIVAILVIIGVVLYLWIWPVSDKNVKTEKGTVVNSQQLSSNLQARAELQFKKRRYQSFVATYEKVLKAKPDSLDTREKLASAYYELAKIEEELGNKTAAEEDKARAMEINPSFLK